MSYLLVSADLDDFDEWKAEFDEFTPEREEFGSQGYHVFRPTDGADRAVVLLEFDSEESAREWHEYLSDDVTAPDSGMHDVEFTYLDLVDRESAEPITG